MAVLIVAVLAAILVAGTNGQSSTCTNALISLSPCLNYITGNATTPSSSCCTQLASVVGTQPQCLCQVVNGGASSLGITVNQTQALALPAACDIQTQPVSRCIAGSPAVSPAVSSTPGSKNTPSTDSSGSSAIQSTVSAFLMLALVASYATAS